MDKGIDISVHTATIVTKTTFQIAKKAYLVADLLVKFVRFL